MSSTKELPCPYKIIDDLGGGYSLGCFAGLWMYFCRGVWYSPAKERIFGGLMLVKKRAPMLGGSFALWSGMFSAIECALVHIRNKDDYWNPLLAGFLSGGILAIRAGGQVALRNALSGSVLLGLFQMAEIAMQKHQVKKELEMFHRVREQENEREISILKKARPGILT